MRDPEFVFLQNVKEFKESSEFNLYKTLRKFRRTLHVMSDNYRALRKEISWFHKHSDNRDLWHPSFPHDRWRLQKRLTTNLLNYLGSKETILYFTRIFISEHFNEDWNQNYNKHLKEIFHSNIEFCVVARLRAYFVHYSLPDVGIYRELIGQSDKKSLIYLHSRDLVIWRSWTKAEREYLEKAPKMLDVEELLKKYHPQFIDTQDIIYLEAFNRYRSQIEKLTSKMERLLEEAKSVNHVSSLPFRESWIRYINLLLKISKSKGFH